MRAWSLACEVPWAITPEALANLLAIAGRQHEVSAETLEALQNRRGREHEQVRSVRIRDGVAVVPVLGPIFRRANLFTAISGATSLELVARDLRSVVEDGNVRAVLLHVDSPGGEATGLPELAQMLHEWSQVKPVVAFTDGLCCSAAYYLASACREVVTAESGILGSIGTVLTVRKGGRPEEVEFVSSQSPEKRADPESDEGRRQYQTLVDDFSAVFVRDVARFRGVAVDTVLTEYGQGGVMSGARAVAAGLADRLGTEEMLLAELSRRVFTTEARRHGEDPARGTRGSRGRVGEESARETRGGHEKGSEVAGRVERVLEVGDMDASEGVSPTLVVEEAEAEGAGLGGGCGAGDTSSEDAGAGCGSAESSGGGESVPTEGGVDVAEVERLRSEVAAAQAEREGLERELRLARHEALHRDMLGAVSAIRVGDRKLCLGRASRHAFASLLTELGSDQRTTLLSALEGLALVEYGEVGSDDDPDQAAGGRPGDKQPVDPARVETLMRATPLGRSIAQANGR